MVKVKVFVSHSSRDISVIAPLVSLIQIALNLPPAEIRCTSLDGYRLPGGVLTSERLRDEIRETPAFVYVASTASSDSAYVALEMGARWGLGKPFLPLLAPGLSVEVLSAPLREWNALRMDAAGLQQMVEQLAQSLDIATASGAVYQKYIDEILREAGRGTGDGIPPASPDRPRFKLFFLLGCGVGNRISLVPDPPKFDDSKLTQFITYLVDVVPPHSAELAKIRGLKSLASVPEHRKAEGQRILDDYFGAMASIPDVVQDHCTEEQCWWFKLGRCLNEVFTAAFLDPKDHRAIAALEMVVTVDYINLPKSLKSMIRELVESARKGKDIDKLAEEVTKLNELIIGVL